MQNRSRVLKVVDVTGSLLRQLYTYRMTWEARQTFNPLT